MSLVFVWFESLVYKIIVEKKYILQYTCFTYNYIYYLL